MARQLLAERQVRASLGIEHEGHHQRAGVIRELAAEFVAPEPPGAAGPQLMKYAADNIRLFTWRRDELEILEHNAGEPLSQLELTCHCRGPPTSAPADGQCWRST